MVSSGGTGLWQLLAVPWEVSGASCWVLGRLLGGLLKPSGCVWAVLLCALGASWWVLGSVLGRILAVLGSLLGILGHLGLSRVALDTLWSPLGALWGLSGGHLTAILAACWDLLGHILESIDEDGDAAKTLIFYMFLAVFAGPRCSCKAELG